MTALDQIMEALRKNRMKPEHEDYGFPRGWNEAFDFIGREVQKLRTADTCPHGFAKAGHCSECNFD